MPRVRDPEGARERLVEAAIEVFASKGFHEALVEEITKASKVSKGAFYLHFPTKQAMFLEVLDVMTQRLTADVAGAITRETGPVAQLDAALNTIFRRFAAHRSTARLVMTQAGAAGRLFESKLLDVHGRFAGMIRTYLDAAIARGEIEPMDTETVGWIWFGGINEVVVRWLYTPDPPPLDTALPALRAVLLRSIGVEARGPHPVPLPCAGEGDQFDWPSNQWCTGNICLGNQIAGDATMPSTHLVRALRRTQTAAEQHLWSFLRDRRLHGVKFRRQHAIGHYIADFYAAEQRLIIELDGPHHALPESQAYDTARTESFGASEIRVLRFTNREVLTQSARVLEAISVALAHASANPNQ